ncbi:MAG: nonstructural protein [Microvirus sp.]|nr:MAG: nonstructural protein [Microvirus sp.]
MKINMYTVLDHKSRGFSNPFYSLTDASAHREFTDAVNDKNPRNQWNKHPADFALYHVGMFDTATAEVIPQQPIKMVVSADSIMTDKQLELISNGKDQSEE